MNKKLIILSLIIITNLLASCSEMNSTPNCPKVGGKGIGCASLDTAYQLSNQGYFNKNKATTSSTDNNSSPDSSLFINNTDVNWQPVAGEPLRYGETVQLIWIAPYVDTNNNYYYPQMVSTVVKNGYWVGAPESEINLSGDQ